MTIFPLDLASLKAAYAAGTDPAAVITDLHAQIMREGINPVWITVPSLAEALRRLDLAKARRNAGEDLPLFGVPFAVKDNIDVAGLPTTAACPAFGYLAPRSATVVEKLEAAGAILLGKNNLDQFATGLTGTRSPYGIPSSVFDPRYISGGSSSGSAVAVAKGLVSFALGTDTAGSGRVPAAFNNIVGLKPTKGWLSTVGVVPACRSLDCVSVFASTVEDAMTIARLAGGFDEQDAFARRAPTIASAETPTRFRFGVPREKLEFFGDEEAAALYARSVERLEQLGGQRVVIDFAPFEEACRLLYGGPWVAERLASIGRFATEHRDDILPVTREIILGAESLTAVEAFEGSYRLAEIARRAEREWTQMDFLLLPTTGTTYRIEEVLADPIRLNTNLGRYANFMNLLDLAAMAVPAGFRQSGLPFGVTLIGRAFADEAIATLAGKLHRALPDASIGATGRALPAVATTTRQESAESAIELAVVGAHLSGQALNHKLTQRGARFMRQSRTARGYSLYALSQLAQAKPGLVFDGTGKGGIEVEVWRLPSAQFGCFIDEIESPLCIGTVALDDGSVVKGFLCEAHAVIGAEDITHFGSWRSYRGVTTA